MQKVRLVRPGPRLSLVAEMRNGRLMKKLKAQAMTSISTTRSVVGG